MYFTRRALLTSSIAGSGLALSSSAPAASSRAPRLNAKQLRVMTYNIRLDTDRDGQNRWLNRRNWVSAQIAWLRPDIFGLQEVLSNQKRDIAADAGDYRLVGVGRDDGRDGGESSPIGYRHDRLALLHSGTFWLSPTPDTPSKGWDAAYPRVATWARLRDRETRRTVFALNTHWDHIGVVARNQSASLLRERIARYRRRGDRVIVLGDFNAELASDALRLLMGNAPDTLFRDSRQASQTSPFGPTGTINEFKLQPERKDTIDHIFVGPGIAVQRYAVIAQNVDGRMPSDHYPVLADLRLE
jgi:endonuclease/exonuclease/phosphatase family metal-dependent hydrolase